MKYLYAFAGIPDAIYEGILKRKDYIVRVDGEFFGVPLAGSSAYGYAPAYLKSFEDELGARLSGDSENKLSDTAFALIYISYGAEHDKRVKDAFFPSVLTVPVNWRFFYDTPTEVRRQTNELADILELATRNTKRALIALADEVAGRSNSTPLLLPVKNFASTYLRDAVIALQDQVLASSDKAVAISEFVNFMKQKHKFDDFPQSGHYKKKLRCFVDDNGVYFKPPGKDIHAMLRGNSAKLHPNHCLLSSRRRLGAPYNLRFHYDCEKPETPKWAASLSNCHGPNLNATGEPHINVAPNDNVR